MPFCRKCGAELEEGDKFCVNCGATVRNPETANLITDNKSLNIPANPDNSEKVKVKLLKRKESNEKKSIPLKVAVVVGALMLVGAIFAVVTLVDKAKVKKEFKQIEQVNLKLESIRETSDFKQKDADSQTNIIMEALNEQAKSGNVKSDSIEVDNENHVITYIYGNGLLGIETVGENNDVFFGSPTCSLLNQEELLREVSDVSHAKVLVFNCTDIERSDSETARVLEKDASDQIENMVKEWEKLGINVNYDTHMTLDDLTNLKGYNFVFFAAHGVFCTSKKYEIKDTYISTNDKYSEETHNKYLKYINLEFLHEDKDSKLAIHNGCYAFSSAFIDAKYKKGDLQGSVFYFAVCELFGKGNEYNYKWKEVLEDKSVYSLIGYHNDVKQGYALDMGNAIFMGLQQGKTPYIAFNDAKKKIGDNDFYWQFKFQPYDKSRHSEIYYYGEKYYFGDKSTKYDNDFTSTTNSIDVTSSSSSGTSSTTESSVESTTKTTASKVVEVNNIYKKTKTFKDFGKLTCSVPEVYISGVNTDAVNAEMYKKLQSSVNSFNKATKKSHHVLYSRYESYIGKGFVSIITWADIADLDGPYFYKHYIYNIDTSDGHIMTKKEALDKFGISEADFTKAVKKKTSVTYDPNGQMPRAEYHEDLNNNTAPKNAVPYMNKSGKLCYATKIWVPGGPQAHDVEGVLSSSSNKKTPKVTVSNAVKKTYKDADEDSNSKHNYIFPKVTISGKNTNSVNKKIKDELSMFDKTNHIEYSYYVNDKVVSILVRVSETYSSPSTEFVVYNISISSGKLLSEKDFIKLCGSTDDEFFTTVKKIYSDGLYYGNSQKASDDDINKNLTRVSYKYIHPYLNKSGKLCFVSGVYGIPPQGFDSIRFDTTTMKALDNWGNSKFV